ncbi:uncharacterized protein LOC134176251 [Corticium candelabrum]|uniref:uncharacterized protein LOC134176251 n=1 Tax=Corticium candelabrum TaxID=121492 RepID=UPI002E25B173|nr:uncharacterized protein LOC134176251 [Corticium candelabrum]
MKTTDNCNRVTLAYLTALILLAAMETTARNSSTGSFARCSSCFKDEGPCDINSTTPYDNHTVVQCNKADEVCFTQSFLITTSNPNIFAIVRGCDTVPPTGSLCSLEIILGHQFISCHCYCRQTICSVLTKSSDANIQGCLQPIVLTSQVPTPSMSLATNGFGHGKTLYLTQVPTSSMSLATNGSGHGKTLNLTTTVKSIQPSGAKTPGNTMLNNIAVKLGVTLLLQAYLLI